MDLKHEWQNMNTELLATASHKTFAMLQFDQESDSLMKDLIFKFKWKLRWVRIIDIPVLIAAIIIGGDLQLLLLFVVFTYELFRFFGKREFDRIKTGVDFNMTTKEVLENNLDAVKRMLKIETIYGYLFLPLSGPIGWLTYQLSKHHSFEKVIELGGMNMHNIWIFAILTIGGFWLAKKMNNSIFKVPMHNLQTKINDLSAS